MSFFASGVSYKNCPVEIREKLHISEPLLGPAFEFIKKQPAVSECVILSTCNRVEFYGEAEDEAGWQSFLKSYWTDQRQMPQSVLDSFYHFRNIDAVQHLFRVTAGLDSLVVGENEILGQVKTSFRQAHEAGAVHSVLYRLFEKSLKAGKDVRAQTRISEGAVSVPSAAVELAEKIFGNLNGEKIMVIGSGEMAALALDNLRTAGASPAFVASRNQTTGSALAAQFGAEWISMEQILTHLGRVDIVLSSTSSDEPILKFDEVRQAVAARRSKPLFLIDIAVPRDIDPCVHELEAVYLYNVDDLQSVMDANLHLRRKQIAEAEKIVVSAMHEFESWLESLRARPAMDRLETHLDKILSQELERLAGRADLDQELIRETQHRIKSKILHEPYQRIKEASKNGGVKRYLEAISSLFNLK
ncbi:MAG TPA: glutamyl-tRNA reductase [Candidatus Omnitrophota bacterium]|nr:glutamyl-tRNA reductase [Candidatus Omnitrophota bacterium]